MAQASPLSELADVEPKSQENSDEPVDLLDIFDTVRSPVALHLLGDLEFFGGQQAAEEIRRIAIAENRSVIVCTEKLRLANFFGFRDLAQSVVDIRALGYEVRLSVSDPRLRAIVDDLGLAEACVSGVALRRAESRKLYTGNRYHETGLSA